MSDCWISITSGDAKHVKMFKLYYGAQALFQRDHDQIIKLIYCSVSKPQQLEDDCGRNLTANFGLAHPVKIRDRTAKCI